MRRHRDEIEQADLESAEEEEQEHGQDVNVGEAVLADKVDGKSALHMEAAYGNLEAVKALLSSFESGSVGGTANYDMIHARDENDFQAVHEAAAGGHLDVLKYLLENGADLNAVTKEGGNVLWWAKKVLDKDHPVILYLISIGATEAAAPGIE